MLLLLAPFAITAFLADVTNILVDEGYLYSFLAAAAYRSGGKNSDSGGRAALIALGTAYKPLTCCRCRTPSSTQRCATPSGRVAASIVVVWPVVAAYR